MTEINTATVKNVQANCTRFPCTLELLVAMNKLNVTIM